MADDLRDEIAEALCAAFNAHGTADRLPQMVSYGTLADAVLTVVNPKLERLREEIDELNAMIRSSNAAVVAARTERDALKAAVRSLLTAQGRMLDDWAEANEGRRRELWQRLHEEADRVRDALATPTPTEPTRRTEQDGGIPNDAITRDDWEAACRRPHAGAGTRERIARHRAKLEIEGLLCRCGNPDNCSCDQPTPTEETP